MKRATLAFFFALFALLDTARAELDGDWTLRRAHGRPGLVHLQLERDHDNFGQTLDLADFSGLEPAHFTTAGSIPLTFSLRREAGTVTFTGDFRDGRGRGTFTFAANPGYRQSLAALDLDPRRSRGDGKSEEEELLALAVLDVSTTYIRSMIAAGYRESLDEYLSMRIFGVTPELVADFQSLGISPSAEEIVATQIHGANPDYIREMRALVGEDLDLDELVATRIHGAEPDFIAEMAALGYGLGDLDLDDYIAFRIHGVSPDFVEELAELGYEDLSADDLVAFRIHGVTPAMIRDLSEEGYHDLDPDDLVSMRIHGRGRRR
jgi:hypothetical protein